MISRIVALILLWVCCSSALGFSTRTERWTENAVLADGKIIKVERVVDYTFQFIAGDGGSPKLFASWPDKFSIKFKHPSTHETIKWEGVQGHPPVLLDFVGEIPYLVVYGRSNKESAPIYGCNELPYAYLKYESGFIGKWSPVPVESAPLMLQKANLSPSYPDNGNREMSPADIRSEISKAQSYSGGFFQGVIPRTYQEWNYAYKNDHLNERKQGDCRPPRAPLPQMVLPTAIEGSPEILETIDYTPDRIAIGDDWSKLAFDQEREGECKKLFRPTDPNDYMQGQRFINDNTGSKPVPYSKTAQFNMGVRVICDEHVWFVTHQEEPGKIVISKFTVTGDLMYRTAFHKPDRIDGFVSYIRIPSLRSEGGYLYFDWLDFRDINHEWHIKRWLKMRMREPKQIGNFRH